MVYQFFISHCFLNKHKLLLIQLSNYSFKKDIALLTKSYLWGRERDGGGWRPTGRRTSLFDAINQIKDQVPDGEEVRNIIKFLECTEKGVITKM